MLQVLPVILPRVLCGGGEYRTCLILPPTCFMAAFDVGDRGLGNPGTPGRSGYQSSRSSIMSMVFPNPDERPPSSLWWKGSLRQPTSLPYPDSPPRERLRSPWCHRSHAFTASLLTLSPTGVPSSSPRYRTYCMSLTATASLSSGHHPRANGQAERANQAL